MESTTGNLIAIYTVLGVELAMIGVSLWFLIKEIELYRAEK